MLTALLVVLSVFYIISGFLSLYTFLKFLFYKTKKNYFIYFLIILSGPIMGIFTILIESKISKNENSNL